jgi:hypothetical protein
LANFLSISPNQIKFSPLFAWSELDISATSDSGSAVSEVYQLNYCLILKLLSGPRIVKLLSLYDNQAAYMFVLSVFGENIRNLE